MPRPNVDNSYLARLRDHFAQHGALPSYAGIGVVVGFKGKTAAVRLGKRLMDAGYLRSVPGGKLAPTERFFELPMFDSPVRAGAPDAVQGQEPGDQMSLATYLTDTPSKTVLIRVRGDSMVDAGVLDGDLAVVERSRGAVQGQFVVAVVDGDFTLKELRFEGNQPVLMPHNRRYAPIRPKQDLEIFGVVRGIVRRYRSTGGQSMQPAFGAAT